MRQKSRQANCGRIWNFSGPITISREPCNRKETSESGHAPSNARLDFPELLFTSRRLCEARRSTAEQYDISKVNAWILRRRWPPQAASKTEKAIHMISSTDPMARVRQHVEEALLAKAGEDAAFRTLLLSDPRAALKQLLGVDPIPSLKIRVIEEQAGEVTLVLPRKIAQDELPDELLDYASGGGFMSPFSPPDADYIVKGDPIFAALCKK
ncbi:NHLP leader peptide family RiPP precursor [Pannonibacter sp. Q-1]